MAKKRLPTIKEAFLSEAPAVQRSDVTHKVGMTDQDIEQSIGKIGQSAEKESGPMDKPSMTHGLEFDDKDIKGSLSALPEASDDPENDKSLKPGSEVNLEPVDLKALGLKDEPKPSEPQDDRSRDVDAEMEMFKSLLLGEDDDEGFDAAYSKHGKTDELDEPFHNEGCEMNEGCGCGSAPPEGSEDPLGAEGSCGEGSCGGMPTPLGPPETFVIKIVTDGDVEGLADEGSPSLNSRDAGPPGGPDFKEEINETRWRKLADLPPLKEADKE